MMGNWSQEDGMVHGSVKVTAYALAAVMAFSGMSITADAAAATTVLPSGGVDLTIAKGNTLENITTDVSGTALEIQSILILVYKLLSKMEKLFIQIFKEWDIY